MKKVVYLTQAEYDNINIFMEEEGWNSKEVFTAVSVEFEGEGIGVDINVCGGDGPFIDPIIYEVIDNAWHELYPLDVEDDILGEYIFDVEGKEYIVEIKLR